MDYANGAEDCEIPEAQIKSSKLLSYQFALDASRDDESSLFKFKCDGGCIKAESVSSIALIFNYFM